MDAFPSTLLRPLLSFLHLASLAVGFAAIFGRARALSSLTRGGSLRDVFLVDNVWALVAIPWMGSGIIRLLQGVEKGPSYYVHAPSFQLKMALVGIILILEAWPMVTLIRWRRHMIAGRRIDFHPSTAMSRISYLQSALVILGIFFATALAKGWF